MIDLNNQTTLDIPLSKLESIASSLSTQEIELLIVEDEEIRTLNREHRGKDSTTDVLSFPLDAPFLQADNTAMPLGAIVIAASYVRDKAIEYGHSQDDELSLLFIHGLLHLLGFDHECDEGEMREKEASIIKQFHLPDSLIIRTQH